MATHFVLDPEDRHAIKDCILRSLQKLNDRDTQKTGTEELHEIFEKYMDSEMVGFVVPVICSPGEASKPWARKESLRLLGALTSTTCIEAELVFSNHALLTRVCTWIKARLGDTDAGVREVAAEVLGTLAANYHAVKQNPLPITHMLFKLVLDSLHVKKEQIAAGSAVQRMAPHVEPLSNLLLKQLIKLIQVPTFNAKQHIMAAFATWDTERSRGRGFITQGRDAVLQSIGALIGVSAKDSSGSQTAQKVFDLTNKRVCGSGSTRMWIGLLGAFSSVDWGVRKGAAETLLALNRTLGPLLEHSAMPDRPRVPRCIEAIKDAKHDRVRPVRDSMSAALVAFQELQDWMMSNPDGDIVSWRQACGSGNGPASARNSRSPTGGRNGSINHAATIHPGLNNTRGAAAALIRSSATFERFVASSRGVENLIKASSPPNQQEDTNGRGQATSSSDSVLKQYQQRGQQHESAPLAGENQPRNQQQESLHAAMDQMRSMMTDLTLRVTAALESLERRVAVLETKATDAANNPSTIISNPYFGQESGYATLETPGGGSGDSFEARHGGVQSQFAHGHGPATRNGRDDGAAFGVFHDSLSTAASAGNRGQGNNLMSPGTAPARSTDLDFVGVEGASLQFTSFGDNTSNLIAHYAGDSFVGRGYASSSPVLAPRQTDAMPPVAEVNPHARNLPQRVSPRHMQEGSAQRDSGLAVCEAMNRHSPADSQVFPTSQEEPISDSKVASPAAQPPAPQFVPQPAAQAARAAVREAAPRAVPQAVPVAQPVPSNSPPGPPGAVSSSAIPSPLQKRPSSSHATSSTAPPAPEVSPARPISQSINSLGAAAAAAARRSASRPTSSDVGASGEHGNSGSNTHDSSPICNPYPPGDDGQVPSEESTVHPNTAALDSFSTAGTPASGTAGDSITYALPHSGSTAPRGDSIIYALHTTDSAGAQGSSITHALPQDRYARVSERNGVAAPSENSSSNPAAPTATPNAAAAGQKDRYGVQVDKDISPRLASLLAVQDDLAVLRLLQEIHAPCWEALEQDVAKKLLALFCKWSNRGSNLARMLPWLTKLLANPPCASVAAFTAQERSATLSAVHVAAFSTRKGHTPEYEQLHKDLSAFWGGNASGSASPGPASSPADRRAPSPNGSKQPNKAVKTESIHNQLLQDLTPPPKHLTHMHSTHDSSQDSSDDDNSISALTEPLDHKPNADRAQVQASLEGIRGIQKALTSLDPKSATAAVNSS